MSKFESPLPILATDTNALSIETGDICKGQISIKNAGGGVLRGRVISRVRGLVFSPVEFEGNTEISYTFDGAAAKLGVGETLASRFFISTNGGEKEIPFSAKLIKMSILTPEGVRIANIRDFFEYSAKYHAQARRLFVDNEFYMLLRAGKYDFMEVYETLHKDANRERAMDNFFILSRIKERTVLVGISAKTQGAGKSETIAESPAEVQSQPTWHNTARLEFSRHPGQNDKIHGSFQVQKSDGGYLEAPLTLAGNAPWLQLSSGKLTTADFNQQNTATINFTIDPKKIEDILAHEKIIVGETIHAAPRAATFDASVPKTIHAEVIFHRLPHVAMKLNREAYRYADHGVIEITNNTGENAAISVFCKDNYVRFAEQSHTIGARGEIPFEIKLSAFMSAQMLFRKVPYMNTVIEIKTQVAGREYKKVLPITVGEW